MKVIGLAGWSGAGKTTLLTRVIPHLSEAGPARLRHQARPSRASMSTCPARIPGCTARPAPPRCWCPPAKRWALMHELRGAAEPRLPELLAKMSRVDLVVVEGFKSEPHRKIEVHRAANDKPLLFPDDPGIVGIATDAAVETTLPTAHLDDIEAVAAMMLRIGDPGRRRAGAMRQLKAETGTWRNCPTIALPSAAR